MEDFLNYLNSISPISEKSKDFFRKIFIEKTYSKKEKFLDIGQVPKKISYLKKGLIKVYSFYNGIEINKALLKEGDFIFPLEKLIEKEPADYVVEIVENSIIIETPYKNFIKEVENNFELARLHRINIQNLYLSCLKKNYKLLHFNATERYLDLLKNNKNIENQFTQKVIASYLGITPIQLSRIRRKLLNR